MFIVVKEHPFFAVSGEDGSFTIPGELPDGEYTLEAWHEKYGTQEVTVNVEGGKAELAEPITFKAAGAMAEPAAKDVRLASMTGEAGSPETKKAGPCGGACCGGDGEKKAADSKVADAAK